MKKKILITYFNNGDIFDKAVTERMWNEIMYEYSSLAKTREIVIPHKRLVEFEDGTVVEMLPLQNIRGYRATHVYASQNVVGQLTVIAEMAIVEDGYTTFDTEGKSRRERFKTFGVFDGEFKII